MISSPLLKQFESGDNLFFKAIRFLILLSGTLLLCFTGILELTWPQQIVLGILFWIPVLDSPPLKARLDQMRSCGARVGRWTGQGGGCRQRATGGGGPFRAACARRCGRCACR